MRIAFALALIAAFSPLLAQEPAPRGQRPQRFATSAEATSVIRGRVTSTTGAIIRGAEIRAREVNGRENRLVTTDDTGAYEIRDLIPGSWNITASKTGFISLLYGQRRPFSAAEPLNVGTRQTVQANFTLSRAGAISGRVLDEFGDPVAGARVQVLRSRFARGRRALSPTGVGDQTDDTGAFRLYALPPGDYYVGAALRAATAETPGLDVIVGAQTYYPGTPLIAEAQRIRLGPGEEQPNVTFSLSPTRSVRVSGTVLSARGGPAEDASVRLINNTDFSLVSMPLGNFGMTQAGGAFTIVNVVPGTYILQADAGHTFGPLSPEAESALLSITVGTEDVTGLTITTAPMGNLTGRVTTESGAPPPAGTQVRVESITGGTSMAFTMDGQGQGRVGGPGRGGPPLAPYSFRLPIMQGGFNLSVVPPEGWMLKSIQVGDADFTDRPVDLRGAANEAVVTLTDRVTRLDGTVTNGTRAAPNAEVLLFPDEASLWAFPARHVRVVKSDAQGTIRVSGIPPHQSYLAVALDYLDEGETQDPEFLESLRDQATRFSIDFGESRTLALRLTQRR